MAGGYWRIGDDNTEFIEFDDESKGYLIKGTETIKRNWGKVIKLDFANPLVYDFYNGSGEIANFGTPLRADIPLTTLNNTYSYSMRQFPASDMVLTITIQTAYLKDVPVYKIDFSLDTYA